MRDLNYQLKQLCRRNRDGGYLTRYNRESILTLIAKPDRQITEWGAELETVKEAGPGTVREAGADKADPDPAPKSPAPVAGNDRAIQPVEMDMDM